MLTTKKIQILAQISNFQQKADPLMFTVQRKPRKCLDIRSLVSSDYIRAAMFLSLQLQVNSIGINKLPTVIPENERN